MSPIERERVLELMRGVDWTWAKSDVAACEEIEWRLTRKAKDRGFLNYSELVEGIEFRIPTINGGRPYSIDVRNWKDLDRAIVGQFLGYLSMKSFEQHGFMLSAIVIGKDSSEPSHHFYEYVKWLGLLIDSTEASRLTFWAKHFKAAHRHFASRQQR